MVAPLITNAARVTKVLLNTDTTTRNSRIARAMRKTYEKSGSSRFAREQSIEARAFDGGKGDTGSETPELLGQKYNGDQSRFRNLPRQKISGYSPNNQTAQKSHRMGRVMTRGGGSQNVLNGASQAFDMVEGYRAFVLTLWPTAIASLVIVVFSIMGLLLLSVSETFGMISIGISYIVAIAACLAIVVYAKFSRGVVFSDFHGIYYVAVMIVPLLTFIPGVNIIPWLIVWTFILCVAPRTS